MKKVQLEIVFPSTFTDHDIETTIEDIINDLPYKKNVRPTIEVKDGVFIDILNWAKAKGILDNGDAKTQTVKLMEETGELAHGVLKRDIEEVKDAIGDMIVVLTSIAYFHGLTVPECIQSAYDVISKRTGKMENGNFVKH
jgi:NTP pyrophosphatase (non-canonical NTP hydrolase)